MFLKRLFQSKSEKEPLGETPYEFQLIKELQDISDALGEYAKASGDSNKGIKMLGIIQKIEGVSRDSRNADLFCALAIAYRNYCAWFVRGDNRQTYLKKSVDCFERALTIDPQCLTAQSELAYLLIEEKQVRNLERGIFLLERLDASGDLSESVAISLQKARRQLGQIEQVPVITDFTQVAVAPAALREQRTLYRALIRKYKKSGEVDKLKEALDALYNLAVFVAAIYGEHDCNSGVSGHTYDLAIVHQKRIGHLIRFNYAEHGRIEGGAFLSENDYKAFSQYYGETDKSINPRKVLRGQSN
jgi:hypothetical protein